MSFEVFTVVKEGKVFLCISIHIFRLFKKTGTQKVIEYLPELAVALKVVNVLFLDGLLDGAEISLEFGVKVLFVFLHTTLDIKYNLLTFGIWIKNSHIISGRSSPSSLPFPVWRFDHRDFHQSSP